jgi:hypothetical protein
LRDKQVYCNGRPYDFGNICSNDLVWSDKGDLREWLNTYCRFSHDIKKYIKPSWKKLLASLGQVQTTNATEFDAEALQEDCKEVRHQNDEE